MKLKALRGMRTAAYKADVAMRPPQARVSQAKLYFISAGETAYKQIPCNCMKIRRMKV